MKLQYVHLSVGTLGLLLFIVQGQYMANILAVPELGDGARLMYRTGHIYLMLASALNVFAGCYLPHSRGKLQTGASLLLLLAPLMLIYSFFAESTSAELDRPATVFAMYFLFAAAVMLLQAKAIEVYRNRKTD